MAHEIRLLWVVKGLEPLASSPEGVSMPSLYVAAQAALHELDERDIAGQLPWLRAGTGTGSVILSIQGIRLLLDAYSEGKTASTKVTPAR